MRSLITSLILSLAPTPLVAGASLLLADPSEPVEDAWQQRSFGASTEYSRTTVDGEPAIRAVGRDSASGLFRAVDYAVAERPMLRWRWRVDRLQAAADLRRSEAEDFAAAIFLIFGEPGSVTALDSPTLAYVWTSDRLAPETVVASPHYPERVRSLVVESGGGRLGQWVEATRDVAADFRRAYGRAPPPRVRAIALFTDNDTRRASRSKPTTARSGR